MARKKAPITRLNVGDHVTWDSQAAGRKTTKSGVILRVIERSEINYRNTPIILAAKEFPNHKRMFDGLRLPGGKDAQFGYFIEVIIGNHPNTLPRLYMPFPRNVRLVE